MLDNLKKDSLLFGVLIALGSILTSAGFLLLGLGLFGKGIVDDPKIFMFAFIPAILMMRWYFKIQLFKSAKGIVLVTVIGFLILMYFLYKMGMFINNGLFF